MCSTVSAMGNQCSSTYAPTWRSALHTTKWTACSAEVVEPLLTNNASWQWRDALQPSVHVRHGLPASNVVQEPVKKTHLYCFKAKRVHGEWVIAYLDASHISGPIDDTVSQEPNENVDKYHYMPPITRGTQAKITWTSKWKQPQRFCASLVYLFSHAPKMMSMKCINEYKLSWREVHISRSTNAIVN